MHGAGQVEGAEDYEEQPAEIEDEMVAEEIDVDGQSQQHGGPDRGIAGEGNVEDALDAGHIGADTGIHEAGKQRHAAETEQGVLRVNP
ncbi:hypothetical protein D9M68_920720 [compost metagenome]